VIDGAVYRKSTGKCTETMVRETWDVSDLIGRKAMIRLVDNAGGGWGHINFDDLRFY
jgi:levanase